MEEWRVSSYSSAGAYGRRAEALAPGLRSLIRLLRRSRQGGPASPAFGEASPTQPASVSLRGEHASSLRSLWATSAE